MEKYVTLKRKKPNKKEQSSSSTASCERSKTIHYYTGCDDDVVDHDDEEEGHNLSGVSTSIMKSRRSHDYQQEMAGQKISRNFVLTGTTTETETGFKTTIKSSASETSNSKNNAPTKTVQETRMNQQTHKKGMTQPERPLLSEDRKETTMMAWGTAIIEDEHDGGIRTTTSEEFIQCSIGSNLEKSSGQRNHDITQQRNVSSFVPELQLSTPSRLKQRVTKLSQTALSMGTRKEQGKWWSNFVHLQTKLQALSAPLMAETRSKTVHNKNHQRRRDNYSNLTRWVVMMVLIVVLLEGFSFQVTHCLQEEQKQNQQQQQQQMQQQRPNQFSSFLQQRQERQQRYEQHKMATSMENNNNSNKDQPPSPDNESKPQPTPTGDNNGNIPPVSRPTPLRTNTSPESSSSSFSSSSVLMNKLNSNENINQPDPAQNNNNKNNKNNNQQQSSQQQRNLPPVKQEGSSSGGIGSNTIISTPSRPNRVQAPQSTTSTPQPPTLPTTSTSTGTASGTTTAGGSSSLNNLAPSPTKQQQQQQQKTRIQKSSNSAEPQGGQRASQQNVNGGNEADNNSHDSSQGGQHEAANADTVDRIEAAVPPEDLTNDAGKNEKRNGSPSEDAMIKEQQQRQQEQERRYALFWTWCRQVLGIETLLDIQTFDYYDYMKALPDEDWQDDMDAVVANVEQFPKVPVRGLAAQRDIAVGEVVIRIPLRGLLSVATTIDQDPVLSTVMGPEIRQQHGWTSSSSTFAGDDGNGDSTNDGNNENMDETQSPNDGDVRESLLWVELPLLALALLHHLRLGAASPLHPYLEILQEQPIDRFPFLWSEEKLRNEVSEGIRTVARGIQRDLIDMYETIAVPIIASNPGVFGNGNIKSQEDADGSTKDGYNDDAPFSFRKFQWAFAMVNTRHWQLPIEDLEHSMANPPMYGDQLPPASTPTDEWTVQRQDEQLELDESQPSSSFSRNSTEGGGSSSDRSQTGTSGRVAPEAMPASSFRHSFLAPVADLLNFGPPCTKGHYNRAMHSFEIVASCNFVQGQEVTFWYSDECDHVMVAMYGFMHPMVPPCPSAEEYRVAAEEWQERSVHLQHKLDRAHDELATLEATVQQLQMVLQKCGPECCGKYFPPPVDDDLVLSDEEEDGNDRKNGPNDGTPTYNVRGASTLSTSSSGNGGGSGNQANGGSGARTFDSKNGENGSSFQRQRESQEAGDGFNRRQRHEVVEHGGRRHRRRQNHAKPRRYEWFNMHTDQANQQNSHRRSRTALSGEPEEHDDL